MLIYLFLALLCLHCCSGFSLLFLASGSYSLVVLAFLVGEHELSGMRASVIAIAGLKSRGSVVEEGRLSCSMCSLLGSGIKRMSPALADSSFTRSHHGSPCSFSCLIRSTFTLACLVAPVWLLSLSCLQVIQITKPKPTIFLIFFQSFFYEYIRPGLHSIYTFIFMEPFPY